MQDGNSRADEAGEWLRKHFEDDAEPQISITLEAAPVNPLVYREVMEILFGPPAG